MRIQTFLSVALAVVLPRLPQAALLPQAGFSRVDVFPESIEKEGALSACRLRDIRLTDMPTECVRFGSDGLKPLDAPAASCGYLAVVDPRTRRGVVAGWISNVNGCGAFEVRREADGAVVLTPILDYGPMPAGTKAAKPDAYVVGRFEDCRFGLESYADEAARYHGIRLKPNRTGYCTWCSDRYGYSDRTEFPNGAGPGTEASTLRLAALADRKLKPYGFDFVQFDDQWQAGRENNGPARDFSRTNPQGPYPRGFASAVRELNARGMTAGVWFIPFGGDAADPSWAGCGDLFVKSAVTIGEDAKGDVFKKALPLARKRGDPLKTTWGGECLDMTNPRARARLAETVRRLTCDWGFRYLKCDGIFTGLAADIYAGYAWADVNFSNAVYADPKASNVSAYRAGLEVIRAAAAPGTFLLGCNLGTIRAMVPSFGLVDAMRIGNDNGPIDRYPARYLEGPRAGTMRYFLNGRVWWNDPDSTYVRASTPLARARKMASWTALTDSLFELGDWLEDLPEERVEILRRTMAHHGVKSVRPIDLFDRELPNGWILDGGRTKVVGVFNWSTNAELKVAWPIAFVGLEPGKTYVGHDFWRKESVAPFAETLELAVPPDDCRILALTEVTAGETVLATSLHVASPVYGVRDGRVLTVAGEPLSVWTYSPDRGFAEGTVFSAVGGWVPLEKANFRTNAKGDGK